MAAALPSSSSSALLPSSSAASISAAERGARATKLHAVMKKALDECFGTFDLPVFRAAFPEIAAHHSDVLDTLVVQLLDALRSSIETEFETICTELGVERKLNEVDTLLTSSTTPTIASSSSALSAAPPLDRVRGLVLEQLRRQESQLTAILAELESGNAALAKEVDSMDREAQTIGSEARASAVRLQAAAERGEAFVREHAQDS